MSIVLNTDHKAVGDRSSEGLKGKEICSVGLSPEHFPQIFNTNFL